MIEPDDVLDFWFDGNPTRHRDLWFKQDPTFDTECGRFAETLQAARAGRLDHWSDTARGMLALIIVLDQFSRNLHRGSADSYAADAQARTLARDAVARGFDRALHPVERSFVYLPFEHSEEFADQDESVRLFEILRLARGDSTVEYAYRHRDVVRRFGRFPHRNAVLGRESTPDELRYLAEPGAGF
jgi:uncharacterized protein (DUF924 family)